MPNQKNTTQLEILQEKVNRDKSVAIVDYSQTTANDQVKLRAAVKSVGGEFLVAKNTIINLALGDVDLKESLNGMNAVVFSYEDEVAAIKELFTFHQESKKLVIKQGCMDQQALSIDEIEALSKLPGKSELISTLINRIQGPSYGLINSLKAGVRDLCSVLHNVSQLEN